MNCIHKNIAFYCKMLLLVAVMYGCLGLMVDEEGNIVPLFDLSETGSTAFNTPKAGRQWDRVKAVEGILISMEPGSRLSELSKQVKKKPEKYLSTLVGEIISCREDVFEKIKAIHDWIAMNIAYDADAYLKKSPVVVEPYAVLRRGSSVCSGYANLFSTMCSLANIQSVVISGHGRGANWSPYREKGFDSNHAWNGVLIQGGWYLIDCTWDAGYLMDDTFKRDYDTGYFCTPPEGFLHTHFPENPAWQLIDKSLGFNEFHELPKLDGLFFTLGLTVQSDLNLINRVHDRAEFVLGVPPDIQISGVIVALGHEFDIFPSMMPEREGDNETFSMAFPRSGKYYVSLSAKKMTGPVSRQLYKPIGLLYFEAASGSDNIYPSFSYEASLYKITIESPDLPYKQEVNEPFPITITGNEDIELEAMLFKQTGQTFEKPIQRRILIQRFGARHVIHVSFPEKGAYYVTVFARTATGSNTWQLNQIVKFPLIALKKTEYEFPLIDPQSGITILSPMYSPLQKGTEVEFEVRAPRLKKVVVRIRGSYLELKRETDGRFHGIYTVEGKKVTLYNEERSNYYVRIAEYDVK
jgi:hypothetical protein